MRVALPNLTISEVAALVGCHADTVRRAIVAGRLRAGRTSPAGPYRIAAADVERWLHLQGRRR